MNNVKLIFLVVILTISSVAIAQNNSSYTGGLRFGYNNSSIYNDGSMVSGTGIYQSFYIGSFGYYKASDRLWIGSGLDYVQNGHDGNNSLDQDREHVKIKLHTLSWSHMARINLGPVFGLAGFAFNIKVDETRYDSSGKKYEIGQDYDWFDMPVFLGVGAQFGKIIIEGRYNWGTWDIDNGGGTRTQYGQIGVALAL